MFLSRKRILQIIGISKSTIILGGMINSNPSYLKSISLADSFIPWKFPFDFSYSFNAFN